MRMMITIWVMVGVMMTMITIAFRHIPTIDNDDDEVSQLGITRICENLKQVQVVPKY